MMENIGKQNILLLYIPRSGDMCGFGYILENTINAKVIGIYLGKYLPENPDVLLVSSSKIMRNK